MTGKISTGRKGSSHRQRLIGGAAFSAMVVFPAVMSLAITYQITDLGAINPGDVGDAHGLNDNTQVVGDSTSGLTQAFYWAVSGPPQSFLPSGDDPSTAVAIDSTGKIAANSNIFTSSQHAVLVDAGPGTPHDLGTLGGNTSTATAINSGKVVGYSDYTSHIHPIAFYTTTSDNVMHEVPLTGPFLNPTSGTDPADAASYAYGVNSGGAIVGQAVTNALSNDAFLYSSGSTEDIAPTGTTISKGVAINNSGNVVVVTSSGGISSTYIYSGDVTSETPVASLGGDNVTGAAINNAGDVVGVADTADGTDPFIYTSADGTLDLNDLITNQTPGWTLISAESINNLGQIVGTEVDTNPDSPTYGQQDAYLLSPPVPEPAGAGLVLIGGSVALLYRRRRLPN